MRPRIWVAAAALVGVLSFFPVCGAGPRQPAAPDQTGVVLESLPDFSDRLVPIYASDRYAGCKYATTDMDANGVRIVNYGGTIGIQHNPVTIAQTALSCFRSQQRSGNPVERRIYLNQINWLMNNYSQPGADLAAYEYHFPWSYGLEPGWRSGLAQGQAISALIRYHYDTGDRSVLKLIRALERLMMLPELQGGLGVTTSDGGIWIEEYPSDPPSLVLNGCISAVFGLYEYTKLFPDNTMARDQLSAAINSIKTSLHHYDSGDWTYLDLRAPPYPKSNDGYALGYVYQLKTLWELTKDPLFLAVGLRWASFYSSTHVSPQGNMVSDQNRGYHLLPGLTAAVPNNVLAGNYTIASSTPMIQDFGIDELFDKEEATYLAPAEDGPTEIVLKLQHPDKVNALAFTLYNVDLYPEKLRLFLKERDKDDFTEVTYQKVRSRRVISYYFEPMIVTEIRLIVDKAAGQNRLVVSEMSLGFLDWNHRTLPIYGSFQSGAFKIDGRKFGVRVNASPESAGKIFAIYRFAPNLAALASAPWAWDYLNPLADDKRPTVGKYYQFRVLCDQATALKGFKDFSVVSDNTPQDPIRDGQDQPVATR